MTHATVGTRQTGPPRVEGEGHQLGLWSLCRVWHKSGGRLEGMSRRNIARRTEGVSGV
jgi:hypothetical protein